MKCKIYEILERDTELKAAFYGTNYNDVFMNGYEGLKRIVYKKKLSNQVQDYLQLVQVKHSFHLTAKTTEDLFLKWMNALLSMIQSNSYFPVQLGYLHIENNELNAQVFYRKSHRKDKHNIPVSAIILEKPVLKSAKYGHQMVISFQM